MGELGALGVSGDGGKIIYHDICLRLSTALFSSTGNVQTPLEFLVENNSSAESKNKAKNRGKFVYLDN